MRGAPLAARLRKICYRAGQSILRRVLAAKA